MIRHTARWAVRASSCVLAVACASGSTPPAAPASAGAEPPALSATSPVAAAASERGAPATPAPAPPATSTAAGPAASTDSTAGGAEDCRVVAELELAYDKLGQGQQKKQWITDAGSKLLEPETAERAFTGISQEILSAIAHKRYEKLGAFAGKEGICMRPARGAPCQILSERALAGCAQSRVRTAWPSSAADDEPPRYSCGEAFRRLFYSRDFLHDGKPHFNCFAGVNDSGPGATLIASGPHIGYVELRSEEPDGTHSLWFVFDGDARAPELVEMISDHSGARNGATP